MITGKTIALTRQTFVGKEMSLLFNMLSRLVIAFLPRSKGFFFFNFMAAVTICRDFGAQENSLLLFPLFPHLFAMKWWKRLWSWEGLGARGEGDARGWDGWMASLTQWTWVWVNSGSCWCTGRPGALQSMGSQKSWTQLGDWTALYWKRKNIYFFRNRAKAINSIDHWRRLSYLSLLFFGTLHSNVYIFTFLLCLSLLFSTICKISSHNHFASLHFFSLGMVLITASCTILWTSVHSFSGTLSDLIPWIYLSLPLYNHKEFDLPGNGLVVFPTFFNLSLNSAIRSSWSEPQSAPGFVFANCSPSVAAKNIISLISVLTSWWCTFVELSLVLLEECVFLLAKLLAFALLHFVCQGQTCTPNICWLSTFAL